MESDYLEYTPEIKEAILEKSPLVALESTIITHGMPYPQNIQTAIEVEEVVRKTGSIPATIALIKGKIKIGLTRRELEYLGKSRDFIKTSRRDLPVVIAQKLNGSTTVSATMICAKLAGIKFFATGGIGGVHRNANKTFDISADLIELSTTNVAVVSAGAKAILNLNWTTEYLETLGVPVIGYKTAEFPSFYSRKSGIKLPYKVTTERAAAEIIKTKWNLGINGGILIANPIPQKYSLSFTKMNEIINKAIKESEKKKIIGKDVTPFLLSYIKDNSSGDSLKCNIELVKNNALICGKIAVAYNVLGLNSVKHRML